MSVKNVILITSKDNFAWTSMQEIIPMIESSWKNLCKNQDYNFLVIDVDNSSPSTHLKQLLSSDLIVVTCFNTKIARFIKIVRGELKIDAKIFFYLHGMATIALWPLQRFGILSLLNSHDLFIGTCDGDLNSLNLTLKNAHQKKIPFTIQDFKFSFPIATKAKRPLAFIGRISPQKNLDLLILAYSELDKQIRNLHPLFIYGNEDHLGYPNHGIEEKHYLEKLKNLTREYGLEECIVFKGFVDRKKIQEELGTNYIFISASTHSDENFGMAAFRALLTGVPCILSHWGGHIEFKNTFKNSIFYLKPFLTQAGPAISTSQITEAIISAIKQPPVEIHDFPFAFTRESIHQQLSNEIYNSNEKQPLMLTPLALKVFEQQEYFESNNQIQRCFKSFEDPLYLEFFKAYL